MADRVAHHASVLLAFRAENVRSFRDQIELSMLATALSEPRFVRQIDWREDGKSIGVVPVAGLFGANASGKSNLLEAMDDMRMYVLESFRRDLQPGEHWPFLLDPRASKRPSRYEIDLVLDGVRTEYGFTLDEKRVVEEWAFRYPRGRAALLFHREQDRVQTGAAGRGETRAVERLLRPNSLLLSAAAAAGHSLLLPLHSWFRRNLQLAHEHNRPNRQALTIKQLNDAGGRERVMDMLRAADLGVVDAKEHSVRLDPRVRERMERAIRLLVGDEARMEGDELDLALRVETFGFKLVHQGVGDDIELAPGLESLGTLVWLGLVGTVIAALDDGAVLLADELDASLHPALVAELIRLFQDPHTNPNRAQLIFNSHDPTILGDAGEDRLLGRDQIWFTEKQADGNSRLYPLTDLSPRKHEAVGRRYLGGRYGATPILSTADFDRIMSAVDA